MKTVDFEALAPGAELPPFSTPPVSRLQLSLYCGASGDHNPLHVDPEFARAAGLPDVIAHGMLSAAWLGRLLTNWVPQDRIRALSVRFVAMTRVGDVVTCSGYVVHKDAGARTVRIALTTRNQAGETTLTGEAVVAFPA